MHSPDQDLIRRVLAAVLNRLEGGSLPETGAAWNANGIQANQPPTIDRIDNEMKPGEPPVIMIILNQPGAQSSIISEQQTRTGVEQNTAQQINGGNEKISVGIHYVSPSANGQRIHSSHERFPIAEPDSSSLAPKTCFMEPDRICINSGVCEMRGY